MTTTSDDPPKDYRPRHARKKAGRLAGLLSVDGHRVDERPLSGAAKAGRRGASDTNGPKGATPAKKPQRILPSLLVGLRADARRRRAPRVRRSSRSPTCASTCRRRSRRSRRRSSTIATANCCPTFHGSVDRTIIPLRQMPPAPPERGDRRRGRALLRAQRRRPQGHGPRGVERPRRARDGPGRFDDHPTAGQARVRRSLQSRARTGSRTT